MKPQEDKTKIDAVQVQPAGNGWLLRSAIGKIRRLISAQGLEEIFRKEGFRNVKIKPIGGRFLILNFLNKEERFNY